MSSEPVPPNVSATFNNVVVVDTERGFNGAITQPRSQSAFSANVGMPILAMSRWAATNQARDQIEIANLSTTDVRTDIAVATAQAYLAIIEALSSAKKHQAGAWIASNHQPPNTTTVKRAVPASTGPSILPAP